MDRKILIIVATAIIAGSAGAMFGSYFVGAFGDGSEIVSTDPGDAAAATDPAPSEERTEPPAYFKEALSTNDAGTPLMESIPRNAWGEKLAGGIYEAPPVRWPDPNPWFTVVWAAVENVRYEPGRFIDNKWIKLVESYDCVLRSRTTKGQRDLVRWTQPPKYGEVECNAVLYAASENSLLAATNYHGGWGGQWSLSDFWELGLDPRGDVPIERSWSGDPSSTNRPDWVAEAAIVECRRQALSALDAGWLRGVDDALKDLKALGAPPDLVHGIEREALLLRFDALTAGPFEFGMDTSQLRLSCREIRGTWDEGRTVVSCESGGLRYGAGIENGRAFKLITLWDPQDGRSFSNTVRDFDESFGPGRLSKRGEARVKTWKIDESRTIDVTHANIFGNELISVSFERQGT